MQKLQGTQAFCRRMPLQSSSKRIRALSAVAVILGWISIAGGETPGSRPEIEHRGETPPFGPLLNRGTPSNLVYRATCPPWGDTFLPKSKPPARRLLLVEGAGLKAEERVALACLQGLTSRQRPCIIPVRRRIKRKAPAAAARMATGFTSWTFPSAVCWTGWRPTARRRTRS